MQDKAITRIGQLKLSELRDKQPYELYIQDMFPLKDSYDMLLIVFEIKSDQQELGCTFKGIDIDKVSRTNYERYAYRKGSSRGGDVSFTTKCGDVDKKLLTLRDTQFKALMQRLEKSELPDELQLFKAVQQCLTANFDKIKDQLSACYNGLGKEAKMASGFSIAIDVEDQRKYLKDFKIIQQIILANGSDEKSEKYSVKSEGSNQQCSVCLQNKGKLHGFASPFKYATVDKPGMVSGFFLQKNNWKNYPVCPECALEFELGKEVVTNELQGFFYGCSYYMIPKTLIDKDTDSLAKAIRILKSHKYEAAQQAKTDFIRRSEERLGELIAGESNYFNLNLLFYEEDSTTKAIKIKLLLEEIVPTRFKKLFVDVPAKVNVHPFYGNAVSIKQEKYPLLFSFELLKTFFEKEFYDLIQKVFLGLPISRDLLFARFMQVIRDNYRKKSNGEKVESMLLTVLKAHLALRYLQELNIISHHSNYQFMDTVNTSENKKQSSFDLDKLKGFIRDNRDFLDSDAKTGIFALGILVRLLLGLQAQELRNTPFEKKLRGYHLNPELLKNIYLETLNKLSQYKGFYVYKDLRDFVSDYFTINTHQFKHLSNNELSFYFVAGLEMGNKFKTEKETIQND